MRPADISPKRGVNIIVAVCLLVLSAILWLPIGGTLYYDGIGDIAYWPAVFYWFLVAALGMTLLATRLLVTPQRVGADVAFVDDGFNLRVRNFFRRERAYALTWRDIEEMTLLEAPRGGDTVSFRLIQSANRGSATTSEVNLPVILCGVGTTEIVSRFHQSAELAGARLVETRSFNVVVVARKLWTVEWQDEGA